MNEIANLNYKYGHILIRIAQGKITDEKALHDRFFALEKKILEALQGTGVEVEFDRAHIPPKFLYTTDGFFSHLPYFPLKFTKVVGELIIDVSEDYFIQDGSSCYNREMAERVLTNEAKCGTHLQ